MGKLLGLLLAANTGCAVGYQTVEVGLTVSDQIEKLGDPVRHDVYELLEEVHEITGYWIKPVRHSGIDIEIVPGVRGVRGRTWPILKPCWFFVRTDADPLVMAHELGHVLGLEHVDDKKNLMYIEALGSELTFHQRRTMEQHAKMLEAMCWDSEEL